MPGSSLFPTENGPFLARAVSFSLEKGFSYFEISPRMWLPSVNEILLNKCFFMNEHHSNFIGGFFPFLETSSGFIFQSLKQTKNVMLICNHVILGLFTSL